jgi:hypothetical protein
MSTITEQTAATIHIGVNCSVAVSSASAIVRSAIHLFSTLLLFQDWLKAIYALGRRER